MRIVPATLVALLAPAVAFAVGFAGDAVWSPTARQRAGIEAACVAASSASVDCVPEAMAKAGAPLAAVSFSRALRGRGWMEEYLPYDGVSVARVLRPGRAEGSQSFVLLGGIPPLIDAGDPAPLREFLRDARVAASTASAFWPSDGPPPTVAQRPGGGLRFTFEAPVRDCASCPDRVETVVAHDFDGDLRYLGPKLLVVSAPPAFSVAGRVKRGETFSVPIDSTRTFRLVPFSEGWTIEVRDAGGDDCAPLTPPYRGSNDLTIFGWHFRNADNTGPRDESTKAPGTARHFLCARGAEERLDAESALTLTLWSKDADWREVDKASRFHEELSARADRGKLEITRVELGNLGAGKRPWIESMDFRFELKRADKASR